MTKLKSADFKKFPTTRYQGSKRKILPWIYKHIKKLDFNTVLDAFGGTASVSYMFKKMNKSITYNDSLRFNYLIGKALIENQNVTLSSEDISNVLATCGNGTPDFIQRNFEDIYFTNSENRWLDNITANIIQMNHYPQDVLEYKKALAYYALFQSCIIKRPFNLFHRKNLYLRTNNVERNFGNKTTWDCDFETHFQKFVEEVNNSVFRSENDCTVLNRSIFDLDENDYDLIYLDPPYIAKKGRNESSDYLRCYHFLEGISQHETWESQIDYNTANHRFKNLTEQKGFKKETIYKNLEEVISRFRNSIIVLSYKKGGTPSIKELKELIGKYKSRVYYRSLHYQYALNKQNGDAKMNREVLIIGI